VTTPSRSTTRQIPRPTVRDGFSASRHRQGDVPAGLISLGAIYRALRRRAWLVSAAALAGLAVSAVLYVVVPPGYQAQTSILIMQNPAQDFASQMQGDVDLAQSVQVASSALRKLGLRENAATFANSYTVAAPTDQILQITASAPSAGQAERQANALAAAFLQYRAELLGIEQRVDVPTLTQQIAVVNGQLAVIAQQLAKASDLTPSAKRKAELHGLAVRQRTAEDAFGSLNYEVANYPVLTLSMIKGTAVLDAAAPIPPSRRHLALNSGLAGLFAGLTVGLGVVLIDAAASDRLRRRRDIARALGAPIGVTVGKVRKAQALTATSSGDVRQLVAHLQKSLLDSGEIKPALAVVPLGDTQVAALALVCLARSLASKGRRVLLADISDGARAARLLRVNDEGIHFAGAERERIIVAVPDASDRIPVGPIRPASQHGPAVRAGSTLAAVYASADILLTIATLDPATGAEHLATWTTDAVVVVTAGRSTATSLKAAGEMIRLAEVRLTSAVLVGAEKADDSLGSRPTSSGIGRRRLVPRSRQSVSA
jgi:capsular polysaccharide biosynthesis protein